MSPHLFHASVFAAKYVIDWLNIFISSLLTITEIHIKTIKTQKYTKVYNSAIGYIQLNDTKHRVYYVCLKDLSFSEGLLVKGLKLPYQWKLISSSSIYDYVLKIHCGKPANTNIFRVTGPLCGELTGHRWIPHTKVTDAELLCFSFIVRLLISDAIALIMASL